MFPQTGASTYELPCRGIAAYREAASLITLNGVIWNGPLSSDSLRARERWAIWKDLFHGTPKTKCENFVYIVVLSRLAQVVDERLESLRSITRGDGRQFGTILPTNDSKRSAEVHEKRGSRKQASRICRKDNS